jgi:glycerol-3-phosphate dehydrogenase
VLRAPRDGRVMFAIPWNEQTLVGTTDTDYSGTPEDVAADADDVRYLLEAVNHYFPAAKLGERDVIGAYAGLRPLVAPGGAEHPSDTSREEELFESASGLLSLGGGKLTTYRRVAERVVDRVVASLHARDPERRFGACRTDVLPLPGADVKMSTRGGFQGFAKRVRRAAPSGIDAELMRHLLERYGTGAPEVAALLATDPVAAERLVPALPYRRGEITHAAAAEHAATLEDALRRRVPLSFRDPDGGLGVAGEVAAMMRSILGWDGEETARAVERYRESIERERAVRTGSESAAAAERRRA